jgi:hypothetical protein
MRIRMMILAIILLKRPEINDGYHITLDGTDP